MASFTIKPPQIDGKCEASRCPSPTPARSKAVIAVRAKPILNVFTKTTKHLLYAQRTITMCYNCSMRSLHQIVSSVGKENCVKTDIRRKLVTSQKKHYVRY